MNRLLCALSLFALAACDQEAGIKVLNDEPTATIISHDDGAEIEADVPFTLLGSVSDKEADADLLEVAWFADSDALCPALAPDEDGRTSCEATLPEGEYKITLEVRDPGDSTATASITLTATTEPVINTAPSCAITGPEDGSSASPGETVTFSALVQDAESDPSALTITWASDVDGSLDSSIADAEGNVSFTTAGLSVGAHLVTLVVTDPGGERCTDEINVGIGDAPDVTIEAPLDGERVNQGDLVTFVGLLASDADPVETLTVAWSSDLDGELDDSPATADGTTSFSTDDLGAGEHEITLSATNGSGVTGADQVTLTVNGWPSAPGVSISPDPASTADDLVATLVTPSVDPEGAAVNYTYEWTRNGEVTSYTGSEVPASATGDEETWTVTVTPDDGEISGPSDSASVTIGNSAPVLSGVTLTPDPAYEGDTLTCTPGTATDADGDTISYTYAWDVDGGTPAVTTATLSSAYFEKSDDVTCIVTASDGSSADDPVESNTVTIENTLPEVSDVTISPASPSVGDTLTCDYSFSDADGDSDRSTIAWTINGASAGTGSTLPTSFDGDDTIICTVTPNDGDGAGTAVSASVTVGNTAPVLASVTLSPSTAYEGDTLTCTPGTATDADGDTVSYSYAWRVSGSTISRTSTTLSSTYFSKADTVVCVVTPTDGESTGSAVTSNTVTIENTAPTVSSVSISPSSPTASSTLTCSYSYSDADGDSNASTVLWRVNGTSAGTGTTLSSGYSGGDTVSCTVTPNDGEDSGTAASASVSIANTAPTLASATLTPTAAYEGDTLTCTPGASSDVDGDTVSYTYAWSVGGSTISRTSSTLSSTYFNKNQAVYCMVTPTDGSTSGAAVTSNTVTIENSLPVVADVNITPSSATASSTLTCSWSFDDDDGDDDASTVLWKVNGVSAGTGRTLSGAFGGGDTVSCTVTANDGEDSGSSDTDSVTISNTAPTLASVSLTPTTAYEASTLTCTPGTATDADGDTVTYTYSWLVDGSSPGVTSATLSGTSFSKTDEVRCSVTPSDGTISGTAVLSNTVTIANTAPVLSAITLSPSSAYTNDTLSISSTSSDADGDTVSLTYSWTVDGTAVSTSSTLSGASAFGKGDVVQVTVTPTDGTTSGSALTASTTILNTSPGAPTIAITPDVADGGDDDLVCYVETASSDVDGDPITYTMTWTVDGVAYPSGFSGTSGPETTEYTDDTVPAIDTDLGEEWICTATPSDGTASGATDTATATALVLYDVGYYTSAAGPGSAGASYLLGPSITVSSATTVYRLGAWLGTAGNGIRMALYTNSGSAPGTLVAYTDTATTALGANELDLTTPVTISAGTYWVMAVYSATTYIYYGSSSTATIKYKAASYASTPTSSFGTASSYTGYPPAYYLVVAD